MEYIGIIIAVLALIVSFWQGWLSKQQLDEAKSTKKDTEELLDEIKTKVNKVETISDETRKDVKEQIAKLIDKQDENMKILLESPAKSDQNQMIMQFMSQAMSNPDMFNKIMELSNQNKNK